MIWHCTNCSESLSISSLWSIPKISRGKTSNLTFISSIRCRSASIPSTMSEIELKTAPADFRFPTTNQTRHCFTRYIEFHRCVAAKGDESGDCDKFSKYYRSLCPGEWVDKWNEQRENGTFPGPL